jgi:hypothetical protein
LNWFEENEFIANSVDDGDGDSNQSSYGNYYFEDSEHFAMHCTPAEIMQESVECYNYDDSPSRVWDGQVL